MDTVEPGLPEASSGHELLRRLEIGITRWHIPEVGTDWLQGSFGCARIEIVAQHQHKIEATVEHLYATIVRVAADEFEAR